MSLQPLIPVAELASSTDRVHICDMRWDLTDSDKGHAAYEMAHIPGAVFVDLDQDLSGPPGNRGRHPLPDLIEFAETLGRLGIGPDTHVVVYDDMGGRIAARLWWMLHSIGHEAVQVLDGGLQAWIDAAYDTETGTVTPNPASYPVPEGFTGVVTHDTLADRTVIDARADERYRGEVEPVDPKAGHIPSAINIPTDRNLDTDGRFLPANALIDVYSSIGDHPVVTCGSGVTACHDALAMVVAGGDMPDVYVGSFSEWSRLDMPVATGPNP